jgi:hypothetical protein
VAKFKGGILMRKFALLMLLPIIFAVFLSTPVSLNAQEEMPDIGKMMKLAKIAQEWMTIGMMIAYTHPLLEWSEALYEEELITGEDCVEITKAVKILANVFKKRAEKIDDATIRKEAVGYSKSVIAEADAYADYYKGNTGSLEIVEKHKEEAEAHIEAIEDYFDSFE